VTAAARIAAHPLRERFLRWQCRVRQIAVRETMGRPDDAVTPALTLPGATAAMGHVITVMSKDPAHSRTAELAHICRQTHDPAQRREKALRLFAEAWYQRPQEFSGTLTATFPPGSPGAAAIIAAGACRLDFDAYAREFALACTVLRLEAGHPLHQATWWHNLLFNPGLHPQTVIVAFRPDWDASSAQPAA